MTTLKDRKRQATRAAILEAAKVLFEKNGFEKTSVDELAAQALISKFTFYNFFGSKEELLNELYMEILEAMNPDLTDVAASDTKVADIFIGQVQSMARWCESHKELTKVLAGNTKLVLPNCEPRNCMGNTIALIEYAQKTGEFKADVDARDIARYVVVLMQGEKREWVGANCSYPLEQKMTDAVRFVLLALKQK
ncbi:MAG TPA: TetR/AcrR family transcriptional regulator [Oculatellaceae cyanobacterium]